MEGKFYRKGWAVEGDELQRSETERMMTSAEPITRDHKTGFSALGSPTEQSLGNGSEPAFKGWAVEEGAQPTAEVSAVEPSIEEANSPFVPAPANRSRKGASAFKAWAPAGVVQGGVPSESPANDPGVPGREFITETGTEGPKASSNRARSPSGDLAEELTTETAFTEDPTIPSPRNRNSANSEVELATETVTAGLAASSALKKGLTSSGKGSRDGPKPSEEEVQIKYFCPPNQKRRSDSLKIMVFHMLPFTLLPQVLVLLCLGWAFHMWGWSALALYATSFALLAVSPPVYSRRLRAWVSDYLYGLLARYVPSAQFAVPRRPFPENRPYIFACHPHGRMFYSTIIFSQRHAIWRRNILKTGDLFMTAAGPFFFVPILRNLFYLVGAIPAGKAPIIAKLRNKDHVTILVGGVKEVLLGTQDDADLIYLKKRKGFCKIAVQENAGVVPVYFFNENQMFRHNSKAFLRFWERINRHVKIGVPFMRGRFFILPMPFQRPLLIAVGEPLFPEAGESVDSFHGRYMQALEQLFHKYLPHSPNANHKLIIS